MPSRVRPYLLLTLLCALLFLPGIASIPPIDRDEARFMQATKQMLETGDWIQIRFQDEPRNKKPIGIYWLQATAVKALGQDLTATWPYRLPSVLAAWLAVMMTCYAGRRLFNPRAGLIAGAALATSFIVVFEAHIAKTDATLLAATTAAMAMLAVMYTSRETSLRHALWFWLALGVGILIKGPVILLVAGATIVALGIADRDMRLLKSLRVELGIPIVLIVVLPWLIAISSTGQSSFVGDALRQDLLPKLIGGAESHGALPGTYLLSSLLTAWPWSVLAPFVLIAGWKHRTQPAVRFCLAWLIPAWIVFEIVPTKLPHYTMPLYPALMLLTGWALSETAESQTLLRNMLSRFGSAYRILWALVAAAMGAAIVYATMTYGQVAWLGASAAALAAIFAGVWAVFFIRRSQAWIGLAAASLLFGFFVFGGTMPYLERLAVSVRLSAALAPFSEPAALAEFHEPSAVFLLGTHTRLTTVEGAVAYAMSAPDRPAVIPKAAMETARARAEGREIVSRGDVSGYNYSRSKPVDLVVIVIGGPR